MLMLLLVGAMVLTMASAATPALAVATRRQPV